MARLNLGRAYMKQGQYDHAKETFDRVLASTPDDIAANALSAYCAKQLEGNASTAP